MTKKLSQVPLFRFSLWMIVLVLCGGIYSKSTAQKAYAELGLPYITNYDKDQYGARYDNWDVLQGPNGLIYVCNGYGVLEYDGNQWRLIKLPQNGLGRSIGVHPDGRFFVGTNEDIGYLSPDSLGMLQYTSLGHLLPEGRKLGTVYRIYIIGNDVYFFSTRLLLRYREGQLRLWDPSPSGFVMAHVVDGTIILEDREQGILRLEEDELRPLTDLKIPTDIFVSILRYRGRLLLASYRDGLYIQDTDSTFVPFSAEANDYCKLHHPFRVQALENGWIGIGTRSGGLIVLDDRGAIVQIIDQAAGLLNNTVNGLATDDQGGLWLALANGLTRVETPSPFSVFDERQDFDYIVSHLIRHQGRIYIASDLGLFGLEHQRPELLYGANVTTSYLISLSEELLVGSDEGVYSYKDGAVTFLNKRPAKVLFRSRRDTNIIYLGLGSGLAYLEYKDGYWQDGGLVDGVEDDIRQIAETTDGNLWLESQINGVWRVAINPDNLKYPKSTRHFQAGRDLPEGYLFLHYIRNEAVFAIEGTVYHYDAELDSIVQIPDYGKQFGLPKEISPKTVDRHGNVWMYSQLGDSDNREVTVSRLQEDGTYRMQAVNDWRVEGVVRRVLYPEDNGIVWYGGADGIVRHDLEQEVKIPPDFQTHIRQVFLGRDSILFGGTADGFPAPEINYSSNSMRFEFAAPAFARASETQYQYQLVGFDRDWSDWSDEARIDYTNLPEGTYQFQARAKNIYQQLSAVGTFDFEILPPWYRSWWAYLMYTILCFSSLYGLLQWRSRQLTREKRSLEQTVAAKTEEIRQQAEQLRELDHLKSQFFANISHEFRTPLTLILGPLEQAVVRGEPQAGVMHRNARRLERLIDQLLALSKIESGNLQLQAEPGELMGFLKALASAFSSHAEQREIQYTTTFEPKQAGAVFDTDALEKIVYNLLSNAFKFTPNGGEVSIRAYYREKRLEIIVQDSGQGIPEQELPHIFDRFYRSKATKSGEQEGTGIGLALCRELVKLHNGNIQVQSTVGRGSSFSVALPLPDAPDTSAAAPKPPDKYTVGAAAVPAVSENGHAPAKSSADGPLLLIVEDNDDLRRYIANTLQPGFSILEAADGKEGLRLATERVPDLIISDLMMPKMDGITLCERLKTDEKTSHIPVILLTAKANRESKLEGLSTGADDYLIKPFHADELQVRTNNLIEQRKKLRQRFSQTKILKPKDIAVSSMDEVFLEKVMAIIEKQMDNADFTVEDFQREIGMSRMQLHRKLKALTDLSTTEFIRNQRLKRAAELLRQKSGNVSEICYQVGFKSLSYFTKMFKEQYGVPPSQYQ